MRARNLASDALKSRGVGIFQFQNLTETEARRLAEQSLELERLCYANFQDPQIELDEFVGNPTAYTSSYWIGAAPEGPMYAYLLIEDHTDGDLEIEDFDELNLPREALELVEEAFEDAPKILYFRDICRLSRRDGLDRRTSAAVNIALREAYTHIFRNAPTGSVLYTEAAYRPDERPEDAVALRVFSRWSSEAGIQEIFRITAEDYYWQGDGSGAVLVAWRKM